MSLSYLIISFSTLFAIVDPIACIGPFLAMTEQPKKRPAIAAKAVIVATILLFLCALGGSSIIKFYGITLAALKLSGGLLLFVTSFEMLYAHPSRTRQTQEEQEEGAERGDVAVFPLAIPLLAGPGAIASVFILAERAQNWQETFVVYLAILGTMAVSYLTLYYGTRLARFFGAIGMNVFTRVMGLILAAISMQFVIDALHETFPRL